jgi:hypothetical protein
MPKTYHGKEKYILRKAFDFRTIPIFQTKFYGGKKQLDGVGYN